MDELKRSRSLLCGQTPTEVSIDDLNSALLDEIKAAFSDELKTAFLDGMIKDFLDELKTGFIGGKRQRTEDHVWTC